MAFKQSNINFSYALTIATALGCPMGATLCSPTRTRFDTQHGEGAGKGYQLVLLTVSEGEMQFVQFSLIEGWTTDAKTVASINIEEVVFLDGGEMWEAGGEESFAIYPGDIARLAQALYETMA